jgi:hypothetical protein
MEKIQKPTYAEYNEQYNILFFFSKHDYSETGFCLHIQVEST